MLSRSRPALLLGLLLAASLPRCINAGEPGVPVEPVAAPEIDAAPVLESRGEPGPLTNPYLEHAPLAWFSVGALAVGGVFYAIQGTLDDPSVDYVAGDRSRMETAVGIAGVTAAAAGIAYFYYSRRDARRARAWEPEVAAGLDPQGGLAVAATWTLPLSLP